MIFVDTNVIIDIFDRDPTWFEWSASQLSNASAVGAVRINVMVIAELSRGYASFDELGRKLDTMALITEPLDDQSGFTAGQRYRAFRSDRAATEATRVLPDFLIGAHALTTGTALLTRDPRLYRRYFPELPLITPETHP